MRQFAEAFWKQQLPGFNCLGEREAQWRCCIICEVWFDQLHGQWPKVIQHVTSNH